MRVFIGSVTLPHKKLGTNWQNDEFVWGTYCC